MNKWERDRKRQIKRLARRIVSGDLVGRNIDTVLNDFVADLWPALPDWGELSRQLMDEIHKLDWTY